MGVEHQSPGWKACLFDPSAHAGVLLMGAQSDISVINNHSLPFYMSEASTKSKEGCVVDPTVSGCSFLSEPRWWRLWLLLYLTNWKRSRLVQATLCRHVITDQRSGLYSLSTCLSRSVFSCVLVQPAILQLPNSAFWKKCFVFLQQWLQMKHRRRQR